MVEGYIEHYNNVCLQLPIPLRMDLLLTPGEHVLWRDLAGCAVEADVVVMLDVAFHQYAARRLRWSRAVV